MRTPSARCLVRVQVAVGGEVDRAVQGLGRDGGHQGQRLVRPDDLGVQADPARSTGRPLQFAQLVRGRCQAQAADRAEDAQALVQLDAVAPEGHHRGRRVEGRHEPRGLARGPSRQLVLLQQQHVRPAGEGQVVGHVAADDAAPDDHDASLVHAHERTR
jgi:hypothetical protein